MKDIGKNISMFIGSIFLIIILLLTGSYIFMNSENEEQKPGPGDISVGDEIDEVISILGQPEMRNDTDQLIWVSYDSEYGFEILFWRSSGEIVEIWLNEGSRIIPESGFEIGSTMEDVTKYHGGILSTNRVPRSDHLEYLNQGDAALYELENDQGNIVAYKFLMPSEGLLYWFNDTGSVTQIVIYQGWKK